MSLNLVMEEKKDEEETKEARNDVEIKQIQTQIPASKKMNAKLPGERGGMLLKRNT